VGVSLGVGAVIVEVSGITVWVTPSGRAVGVLGAVTVVATPPEVGLEILVEEAIAVRVEVGDLVEVGVGEGPIVGTVWYACAPQFNPSGSQKLIRSTSNATRQALR